MSEVNSEIDPVQGGLEGEPYDDEALHARRRQYGWAALAVAAAVVALLAVPWRDHVTAGGRAAPQRWARVHTEAPGVIREVAHMPGDTLEQGEVIAVLDYDDQHDALEAARLALSRQHEKLSDIELRLHENSIQRDGAEALARTATQMVVASHTIDGPRLATLDPVASTALESVRNFVAQVRAELAKSRPAPTETAHQEPEASTPFRGEDLYSRIRDAMARYTDRATAVADQLEAVAGAEAGRQFRFELEDLHFAYERADHSMQELIMKHQFVEKGVLAAVTLREPCSELERETLELAHNFRTLSASARTVMGTPAEQAERVRAAQESQNLLASESQRLESERSSLQSDVAAAEIAVHAAERHQGQAAIRSPIRGTLSGEALGRFDAVSANAPVGVVEDLSRLNVKVEVADAGFYRVMIGQTVDARGPDGRSLTGKVIWKTPLAGQTVKDQAWNVLIQLDGNSALTGLSVGDKVQASILTGRRSLVTRWFKSTPEAVAVPRVAMVDDPTELRGQVSGQPANAVSTAHEDRPVGQLRGSDGIGGS